MKYKSEIHTSTNTCFGWTGKTFGAYAIHNWNMKDDGNKTKVFVSESLSGFAIILMRKKMNKELPKLLEKDLADLKQFCEQK